MTPDLTKPLPDTTTDEPFVLTANLRITAAPIVTSSSIDSTEKTNEQPKDYVNPAEISFEEEWYDLNWDKNDGEAFSNLDVAPLVKIPEEPATDDPPAGLTELEYDALREVIRDVVRQELGTMLEEILGKTIRHMAQDEAKIYMDKIEEKGRIT